MAWSVRGGYAPKQNQKKNRKEIELNGNVVASWKEKNKIQKGITRMFNVGASARGAFTMYESDDLS